MKTRRLSPLDHDRLLAEISHLPHALAAALVNVVTPEALGFIETAAAKGVRTAVERRDGPFGDYSQAPPELRPDPSHVITP